MSAFYWGRPEIREPFLSQMPLGRWATEDEIAAPIVFLLSDGASMITGVSLPSTAAIQPAETLLCAAHHELRRALRATAASQLASPKPRRRPTADI